MFIYGSSARREQDPDSDIDLMVIGDVTLKDLTPYLRRAEEELGKQIGVTLYTGEEWRQRREDRNPFVRRVSSAEKVYVIGGSDDLAAVV